MEIICNKLECNENQASEVIEACIPFESIDLFSEYNCDLEGYEERDDRTPREFIVEDDLFKYCITFLLEELKEREREIIIAHYGLSGKGEMTLEDIGRIYGLTRERIRQIEAKALKKLKHHASLKELIEFL